ncbi:hypothetical protein DICVIV_14424 [Dictyocaulus viviparus]|uniref:Uncharacterized protein n=1 Tax=Dictyocaulus viviparus TaxID=29172 RepID=A0A0D8XB45_DICVI|nr:hypothetical protein DICVIV_14424 [Dictyocaulus viviparus]
MENNRRNRRVRSEGPTLYALFTSSGNAHPKLQWQIQRVMSLQHIVHLESLQKQILQLPLVLHRLLSTHRSGLSLTIQIHNNYETLYASSLTCNV